MNATDAKIGESRNFTTPEEVTHISQFGSSAKSTEAFVSDVIESECNTIIIDDPKPSLCDLRSKTRGEVFPPSRS